MRQNKNGDETEKTREQLLAELAALRHRVEALEEAEAAWKQTEQALRESEQQLRSTFASLDDLVFVLDRDGVFVDFYQPDKAARLYVPPETFLGKPLPSVMPRHVSERWKEAIHRLETTGAVQQFDYSLLVEGEERWYTAKISIRRNTQGDYIGVTGVIRNISFRKQIEAALRETQDNLTQAHHVAHIGTWAHYPEAGRIYWSDELFSIFGREKQDLSQEIMLTWVHPDDRAYVIQVIEEYIRERSSFDIEYRLIRPDGSIRFVHATGKVIHNGESGQVKTVGTVQDITERKQVEKALEDERRLLNTVLDHLPVQVYVKDRESRFLLANTKTMIGLDVTTPEEYLGKTDFELLPNAPDKAAEYFAEERAIIQTGKPILNKEHIGARPERGLVWTVTSKLPLRDAEGNIIGIVGIGVDITKRKQAEIALRESESRYRVISELMTDYAFGNKVNPDGTWENEWITEEAYARMTGYTPEEISHKLSHYHPEDRERAQRDIEKVIDGEPSRGEYRLVIKNGDLRWIAVQRQPVWDERRERVIGFYGAASDITERKEAEDALRESESKLRSIFRVAPTGIGLLVDRVLMQVNDRVCEMVGRSQDELIGKSVRILYPSDAEYELVGREKYTQIRTHGTGTVETKWQHKDGTLLDVLMGSAPIDPQDLSAGVTITSLDITERKRAEEQALALSMEKERTHLITQFIQAASHEFRTPLSMINLSAHVIERTTDSDQHKDRLEQIKTQVQNITRLVNDLVTMARLDDGVLEDADWFDVNRILGNIEVALQDTADEAGVTLNIESAQNGEMRIRGNVEELFTAVTNIVMNGLRYTPEGGTVTVRARSEDDACVIDVQDTGIGMSEEEVSHIFERFYRVDEARTSGGFGLGLPIAWKIIERHNGHIEVESTPGQGSTFRITIPCNEGE